MCLKIIIKLWEALSCRRGASQNAASYYAGYINKQYLPAIRAKGRGKLIALEDYEKCCS